MGTNGDHGHFRRIGGQRQELSTRLAPGVVTPGSGRISRICRGTDQRLPVIGDGRRRDLNKTVDAGRLCRFNDIARALHVDRLELRPRSGHRDTGREVYDGVRPRHRFRDDFFVGYVTEVFGYGKPTWMPLQHRD